MLVLVLVLETSAQLLETFVAAAPACIEIAAAKRHPFAAPRSRQALAALPCFATAPWLGGCEALAALRRCGEMTALGFEQRKVTLTSSCAAWHPTVTLMRGSAASRAASSQHQQMMTNVSNLQTGRRSTDEAPRGCTFQQLQCSARESEAWLGPAQVLEYLPFLEIVALHARQQGAHACLHRRRCPSAGPAATA